MPLDKVLARDEDASDTCHRAHLRREKTSFAFYFVTEFSMDNGENVCEIISREFRQGFLRQVQRRNSAVFQVYNFKPSFKRD